MVEESKKKEFFIQIDGSKLAEFKISEFEILRVDCTMFPTLRFLAKGYLPASHGVCSSNTSKTKVFVTASESRIN